MCTYNVACMQKVFTMHMHEPHFDSHSIASHLLMIFHLYVVLRNQSISSILLCLEPVFIFFCIQYLCTRINKRKHFTQLWLILHCKHNIADLDLQSSAHHRNGKKLRTCIQFT